MNRECVTLIINYYIDKNKERQKELDECLLNNCYNPVINRIIAIHDPCTEIPVNNKIIGVELPEKPTWNEIINISNLFDGIKIIANTDIFFNNTLRYVHCIGKDQVYALCRYDLEKNGKLKFFERKDSQDVWIYKEKAIGIDANYGLGVLGCLSGDTDLWYKRGKRSGGRNIKLKDLYKRFNGLDTQFKWDLSYSTHLQSFNKENNSIFYNKIVSVIEKGFKSTIKITFNVGNPLILTNDHLVCNSEHLFVRADSLIVGNEVLCKGDMKPKSIILNPKKHKQAKRCEVYVKYYPYGKIASGCKNRKKIRKARLVYESKYNNLSYDEYIYILNNDYEKSITLNYLEPKIEVHHKDWNSTNDTIDNLEILSKIDHAIKHSKLNNFNCENLSKKHIINIEPFDNIMTYDIMMESPYNNFIANDIVVHNCDGSIAYEFDKIGKTVISPSLTIQAIHLHNVNVRNYGTFRLPKNKYKGMFNTKLMDSKDYKILFKYPIRQRRNKFFDTLDKYYSMKSDNHNFQFVITIDEDDKELNNDFVKSKLSEYPKLSYHIGNNKSKVEAINADIPSDGWDIVVLISDDMIPVVNNYDMIIRDAMMKYFNNTDGVLWFNDGSPTCKELNTLSIIGKDYYNRFGYIYNHNYKSLWCDKEFMDVANNLQKQKYIEDCIIKHEHVAWGFGKEDSLLTINNSYVNVDKSTYYEREKIKFSDGIPKKAFFIWSKHTPFSYFRYLTLETFRKHNPNFEMTLYLCESIQSKNWNGGHIEQEFYNEKKHDIKDYINKVNELGVKILEYNNLNTLNPTQVADVFRFDILFKEGGWFFDVDQLFIAPIPDSMTESNNFVFGGKNIEYIGVIGASKGLQFCKNMNDKQFGIILSGALDDYQTIGNPLFSQQLVNDKSLKHVNVLQTKDEVFYPIFWDNVGDLYDGKVDISLLKNTIAIHWHGGYNKSQIFNKTYSPKIAETGKDSISKYLRSKNMNETERIFTEIKDKNLWKSNESVSGTGSSLRQTEAIIKELPKLFKKYGIKSILDAPCGDFNWMSHVDLSEIDYIGGDIVRTIIESNQQFKKPNISFIQLNLIEDKLPKVDLILCRDCLVHFSYSDCIKALNNIYKSGAKYFLTTSFGCERINEDIKTGSWYPINLMAEPFNFPKPIKIINEGCTEGDGQYSDKSLYLWKFD